MTILGKVDITELEKLLLKDGQMLPVAFADVNKFTQEQISTFCHKHAIYQIITTELLDFVTNEIDTDSAIEIGSGNGCLGRSLQIPLTDNKMQEWPEIEAYYNLVGQPPIKYPVDVIEMPGNDAIAHYKPDVVVASWVTQKFNPNLSSQDGNAFGVNEKLFKGAIKKYIHIGNEGSHSTKEILKIFPYNEYKFDWLVSRSMARHKNVIYVFDCK